MEAFTARNVSKHVLRAIVAAKVTQIASDAAANYTRYEEDDMVVKIGSGVVGWGVAYHLQPVTNAIVDKTADFITEQRTKRAAKKNTEEKN
jgi:hypothetical protein